MYTNLDNFIFVWAGIKKERLSKNFEKSKKSKSKQFNHFDFLDIFDFLTNNVLLH